MTKVLLIDPGRVGESWYEQRQCPSLGLAYIGSYLKLKGIENKIIDMVTYGVTYEELPFQINSFEPDIVGISSASFNILDAYKTIEIVKQTNAAIFTVLGGAHATALPQQCLKECKALDAVVVGEGEIAMQKICECPKPGIYQEPFIDDLDSLPFPDWSMYDYSKYIKA